ncbi:arsenic resistance protein [Alkalilimnicola sp. S0819]|uniref:arsenic resistance protein n=1 Tax=Alkalilimnicola sp. S0819 TaxID=2613922 RepID=UPI001261DC27|nr:arsenic resistance protein [Alkalilimnicola sp. S0819]KAB7627597.1 arsenic resistance protein [Alkalilimnicola sp. S0819]MPQ15759.1 arsenic resistance protein [Alkalilimnicola sp. S0819]
MTRIQLERNQVWLYLLAITLGLILGNTFPAAFSHVDTLLWPLLALLLFTTFTQIPLARPGQAFRDARFIAAVLIGNFLLVPVFVWGLLALLPASDAIRLGVLLVLLVPCTDWFVTFVQLGGGDARRAVVVTPINLLLQLLLLPMYLWLFLGRELLPAFDPGTLLAVVLGILLMPLLFAGWMQGAARQHEVWRGTIRRLGGWPVPLLALVVFFIAASQVQTVLAGLDMLGRVALVFIAYLVGAALFGRWLSRAFALPPPAARTLTFSLGTRNSFMMLPFALALPSGWELAAVAIVLQSLVELFGMLVFLAWLPERLFPHQE